MTTAVRMSKYSFGGKKWMIDNSLKRRETRGKGWKSFNVIKLIYINRIHPSGI